MILTETPRRIMVTKLVNWGHWFALSNIVIAILISSIYVFTAPTPETGLGTLFLFTNWFSHVSFLTFFGFVIFILPLCYLIPKSRLVKGISSVVAAVGLALLAFDALLYTKYGLHLSFGSADLIKTEAQTVIADFGFQQWGYLTMLFVVWLSLQLVVANAIWKRLERLQKYRVGIPISSFFVACFVSSHAMHVWADANLYQPIVQQDDLFPLSYPATAKNLMSKYGLLDYQSYNQRKSLQFSSRIKGVKYPANPVYCNIDTNRELIILIQTDGETLNFDDRFNFNAYPGHYDLSANTDSAVLSTLFGLPEIYLPALADTVPVMLDLPTKLGIPVSFYYTNTLANSSINTYAVSWEQFSQNVQAQGPKLAIGFVSAKQLEELLSAGISDNNHVMVSQLSQDRKHFSALPLYANFPLQHGLSSQLDIAATALNQLGCMANTDLYTIGQNLSEPRRNWLVGTNGSKVIILQNNQRIELLSNGSYKVYDRLTAEESAEPLNTGLLSQAIKHLSRFTK